MARAGEGGGEGSPRPQDEYDYSAAFEAGSRRVKERARKLAREREDLPRQLHRLLALPPGERQELLEQDPSLASWTLAEHLVEQCLRRTFSRPRQAAQLAELAIAAAAKLAAAEHGPGLVEDLRAWAWAARGETRRLLGDLQGAEEAFTAAGSWLAHGTGEALEEARVIELEAALHRDLAHTARAHGLLDAAAAIYRRCQDFHQVGSAYVEKGRVFAAVCELEPALHWVRKGLGLVDSRRDPDRTLAAQQSLMLYLYEGGRVHEAWFMLQGTRPDFAPPAGELLNLRLGWLEGNLQHALGMLAESEATLARARAGFVDHGLAFEAALTALDLFALYAEQGRGAAIRQLAEQMPFLRSPDLPAEAAAALSDLMRDGPYERPPGERVRELADHLRWARRKHRLRFDELP